MHRRFVPRSIMAVASLLALPLSTHAVTLNVPVSPAHFADTTLPGTTSALRSELAGTVLADVLSPFSFDGVSGTVQNRVVRETGTGTLDFYWKINVDSSSHAPSGAPYGISAFRLADFGYSDLTDADWRIDGLGTAAPSVGRLFNVANYPTGDINFLFDPTQLSAGNSSRFFFLHTDATNYAQTAFFDLLDQNQVFPSAISTFAPAAAVPEPGTVMLMGAGILMMLSMGRRRHRVRVR